MNTMLVIENDGELDVSGLRLMGATSKDGQDGKIGFYGTGTKYAIASALRMGVAVHIYSGERHVVITTRTVPFRGESYEEIMIDGHPTGITTRTGIQWEPWYILREFLCNAIDEGGLQLDLAANHSGVTGKTRVYVELNKELSGVYDGWDSFFSFDRVAYHSDGCDKVYLPHDPSIGVVYRRGVRVWKASKPSVFDYDLFGLQINEARVAKSEFEVAWGIISFWKNHATAQMLTLLFAAPLDRLEWSFDWSWAGDTACEAWFDVLRDYVIVPKERSGYYTKEIETKHVIVPMSTCVWLFKAFGRRLKICGVGEVKSRTIEILPPDDRQRVILADAIGFLKFGGFDDIDRWPIHVADLGEDVMGMCENDAIYISPATFLMGRRQVTETLLEEYGHAKSRERDETRQFQNVLLRFVINAIESKTGKYL